MSENRNPYLTLAIDTGDETFCITNAKGEAIAELTFNPADVGIGIRYKEASEHLKALKDSSIDDVLQLDEMLRKEFAFLLGRDNVSEAFSKISPLALLKDGRWFFEALMETVSGIIDKTTEERMKKTEERIQKAVKEIIGEEDS